MSWYKLSQSSEWHGQSAGQLIEKIPQMSIPDQIKLDMWLHKTTIDSGKYDDEWDWNEILLKGIEKKKSILDIFLRQKNNPEDFDDSEREIRKCINGHRHYLSMPEYVGLGSHKWHQTWVNVYEGWLKELEKLRQNKENKENKMAYKLAQSMFESEGILEVHDNWLFIQCDPELTRYYISRFNRSHVALDRQIMPVRWGGHISIVCGEEIAEDKKHLLNTMNQRSIKFQYEPIVKDNGNHFWLDIRCDEALDIREGLGLPRDPPKHLHMTIGVIIQP